MLSEQSALGNIIQDESLSQGFATIIVLYTLLFALNSLSFRERADNSLEIIKGCWRKNLLNGSKLFFSIDGLWMFHNQFHILRAIT